MATILNEGTIRYGYAFNNPDTTSDYHAPKWGYIVHPDELRYDEMFGNELTAQNNSQVIVDDQLADYARCAIAHVEQELNIDILPRRIRYMDRFGPDGKPVIRPEVTKEDADFLNSRTRHQQTEQYIREPGYAYRVTNARAEAYVKLRRRPVNEILTAEFVDPYFGNTVINLMPYRIVKPGYSGVCNFRPNAYPSRGYNFNYIWQTYLLSPFYRNMQNLFLIDYTTGYANMQDVPTELRQLIKKIATYTLYNTFGLGKIAGIASQSVSLNSVTESLSTTQSATSSLFGAQMLAYQKWVAEWFKQNRSKYSRTNLGCLGG